MVIAVTFAVIAFLVLTPLFLLLYRTFFTLNGAFTLRGFTNAYNGGQTGQTVLNTVVYAGGAGLLAVVVGAALAYVNVRTDMPFKKLFFAAALVPLVVPAILYAPAWVFLASPKIGLFNHLLSPLLGGATFDVYSLYGMILVQGLHGSPVAFLLMVPAFRSMDPSLEESARMSGAKRFEIIRLVTLPLVRPALISAGLLVTIQALESFEIPALIGLQGGIYTFTTQIYFVLQRFPIDYAAAGALSLGLLVLAMAGVLANQRLSRGLSRYGTVSGKAFRPRPVPLGRARVWVGLGVSGYFLVAVVAPVLVLVYASLLGIYETPSAGAFHKMSFANYATLMHTRISLTALRNSVLLGIGSATIVMMLTAVAGWFTVRSKSRLKTLVDGLTFTPIVVPGLVLGLALVFVYVRLPLAIYGTLAILLIAYVTRFLPYGIRYSSAAMHQISAELEESARVSGASWLQSFRHVLLPLTSSGLIAGWIYIFLVSFRELSTSILLYTPGREVLSVLVFSLYQDGSLTQLAALGVVMIVVLVLVVSLASAFGARIGVREQS